MKLISRILLVFGLLGTASSVSGQDQVPWAPDFKQACALAAQHQRLVLLHMRAAVQNWRPAIRSLAGPPM
jgi:hypothetical protein